MKLLSKRHLTAVAMLALSMLAFPLAGCHSEADSSLSQVTSDQAKKRQLNAEKIHKTEKPVSLNKQLSDRAAASAATAPEDRRKVFNASIDLVRQSNIEQTAKQVGDAAVDGELIGWDGKTFRLSQLWREGPVVLMWYRGGWCPYCNIQLRAMQQRLDEIENAGAKLVVLTPELPEKARDTAKANHIKLVALHDRENRLAEAYGIMFDLPAPIVPIYRDQLKICSRNGCDKMQLPLAATYVIDRSGKITYAFLDADYKKRAEPDEVLAAVVAAAASHE